MDFPAFEDVCILPCTETDCGQTDRHGHSRSRVEAGIIKQDTVEDVFLLESGCAQ